MSADAEYKSVVSKRELHGREKLEAQLSLPIEFYICLGSTFYLIPSLAKNDAEIAFDWLWIHIGIQFFGLSRKF